MVFKPKSSILEKLRSLCFAISKQRRRIEVWLRQQMGSVGRGPYWTQGGGDGSRSGELLNSWTKLKSLATVFSSEYPGLTLYPLTLVLGCPDLSWRKLHLLRWACQSAQSGLQGSIMAAAWAGFDAHDTSAHVSGGGSVTRSWGVKPVSVMELFCT